MAYAGGLNGSLAWRGSYSTNATYFVNDVVSYNGGLWQVVTAKPSGTSLPAPSSANQSFSVPSLGSTNATLWYLNGTATNTNTGECRLTPASGSQTGSTYYKLQVDLTRNATLSFQSECSGGTGADGYCLNLIDPRYNAANPGNLFGTLGNGGFYFRAETYSSYPGVAWGYRDSSQATPTTTSGSVTDSTAGLRQINNWVFTFTRTATNTYTVGITKNGTTYGSSPYAGWFIPDSVIIGFTGATGGSYDNQYIRNFSLVTPSTSVEIWAPLGTTLYGAGVPGTGNYAAGTVYVNSNTGSQYFYTGTAWVVSGGVTPLTVTSNYTMAATDSVVLANGTGLTVTLPAPGTAVDKKYIIKNLNASALTVATPSGNIDGVTSQSLAQNASLRVVSDTANWWAV